MYLLTTFCKPNCPSETIKTILSSITVWCDPTDPAPEAQHAGQGNGGQLLQRPAGPGLRPGRPRPALPLPAALEARRCPLGRPRLPPGQHTPAAPRRGSLGGEDEPAAAPGSQAGQQGDLGAIGTGRWVSGGRGGVGGLGLGRGLTGLEVWGSGRGVVWRGLVWSGGLGLGERTGLVQWQRFSYFTSDLLNSWVSITVKQIVMSWNVCFFFFFNFLWSGTGKYTVGMYFTFFIFLFRSPQTSLASFPVGSMPTNQMPVALL